MAQHQNHFHGSPPLTPTESNPLFQSANTMAQPLHQNHQQQSDRYQTVGDRDSSSSEGNHSEGSSRPFGASRDSSHSISQASGYPTSERPLMANTHRRASSNFDDLTPEILGLSSTNSGIVGANYSRYSSVPSRHSVSGLASLRDDESEDLEYGQPNRGFGGYTPGNRSSVASFTQGDMVRAATTDALLWDEKNMEGDDYLHNPDPSDEPKRHYRNSLNGAGGIALPVLRSDQIPARQSGTFGYSTRGLINFIALFVIVGGLVGIFAFWPIATYIKEINNKKPMYGWNLGGTNSSGQVPEIANFPSLIDSDTPAAIKNGKRKGYDGQNYKLVFSDEFNTDGRTFHPGDDPFWEGVDLNYWQTVNYEWVDPDAVITQDGNLLITMSEQPTHDLNFQSGFVQSWNKFCLHRGAYIEMNVSLPGRGDVIGLWPGLWTMGNLGRAGYGATNDGLWPYSYDTCDVGTQPGQLNNDRSTPTAARTTGEKDYGGTLSYLAGQRLSACTCKGDEHPGPRNSKGRGAPEIDILEAQVDYHGYGSGSQSMQVAPFDAAWAWKNDSTAYINHIGDRLTLNDWKGSITQESASAVTRLDNTSYEGAGYQTFGFEYWGGEGEDAYITWYVGGEPTWTLTGAAFPPNADTEIGSRLISEEPMYLMMNLFISSKFQGDPDFGKLTFPNHMRVDYVRVWQRENAIDVGCDPSSHPTAKYIQDHLGAYTNPNYTTWEQAGFEWPRNSRMTGGCSTERAGP